MANRNAASIINQMKYSGIKQKELQGAVAAEGRDNKAVSQYDRMLGKQVAGEESRMQEIDKFADDLSMRKDKLSFSKKIHAETTKLAEEQFAMQEDKFSHDKLFTGIEAGIGLASVGTNYWRNQKQKEMDVLLKENLQEKTAMYKRHKGVVATGMNPHWQDYEYY